MSKKSFKIDKSVVLRPQDSVPPEPEAGELYYDYSANAPKFYDGSKWNYIINNSQYAAIIGTPAQVGAGIATHTTLRQALIDINIGQAILVLQGTFTGNVVIDKRCTIEGIGASSIISGDVTCTASADYCKFGKIRVTGNITIDSGSNYNDFSVFWCAASSVVTDNGTANYILGIQD